MSKVSTRKRGAFLSLLVLEKDFAEDFLLGFFVLKVLAKYLRRGDSGFSI